MCLNPHVETIWGFSEIVVLQNGWFTRVWRYPYFRKPPYATIHIIVYVDIYIYILSIYICIYIYIYTCFFHIGICIYIYSFCHFVRGPRPLLSCLPCDSATFVHPRGRLPRVQVVLDLGLLNRWCVYRGFHNGGIPK